MNRTKQCAAIVLTLLLSGCPARSLFPLFTEGDLVFDPDLIGEWTENDGTEVFSLQRSGEKEYAMALRISEKETTTERVQVGRIDSLWFMDSSPVRDGSDYHLITAHIFSRFRLDGDTLRISHLEGDWLREMIDEGKLSIPHIRRGEEIILTASPEELQGMMLQCAEDERAFPGPYMLVRKKE